MYEQRTTQEQRILDLFTERKGAGVYAYELAEPRPQGLGILQYNARIYGLRHRGFNIISDYKGHFIIKEEHQYMTQDELSDKLAKLRGEWVTAGPGLRKLIQVRANLLKKRFAEENQQTIPYDAAEEFKKISGI